MERDTRRLALVSVGLGIAIVTLLPAHAGLAQSLRRGLPASLGRVMSGNLRATDAFDFIQNVLLYLPFGFFAALPAGGSLPGKPSLRRALRACLAGTLLSGALEFSQLWIPGRFCSALDVLTNGLGSLLGALAVSAFRPGEADEGA